MKKFITMLLLLVASLASYSQGITTTVTNITTFSSNELRSQKPKLQQTHNTRIGWGAYPIYSHQLFGGKSAVDPGVSQYYKGTNYSTGSIFAEYTYQAQKWLEVGGSISYSGEYQNIYDRITDKKIGVKGFNSYGIMATARFNYLNRGIWRLYGQISLGVAVFTNSGVRNYPLSTPETSNSTEVSAPEAYNSTEVRACANITLLGVSVGRKYYGFLEFPSIGRLGVVNAGFGIRFNDKK